MKQLRVILLLFLFLQSKIGLAFNIHYCGEHIAKISWAFDAKGCGMEKKPKQLDKLQFNQKNCCQDDVIIAQDDTDQKTSEQEEFEFNLFQIKPIPENRIAAIEAKIALDLLYPPPPKRALYRINCASLFYE